jgi:hypothetical protein
MSQNLEIVRRMYPGTVDVAALVADPSAATEGLEPLLHPDFETVGAAIAMPGVESPQEAGRRAVRGVAGFIEGWRDFLGAWESWVITPTEFIDVDDERILILLDVRARSKTHQVEIPIEAANLVTLRDGKLARLEMFSGRAEAFEAAGLSS